MNKISSISKKILPDSNESDVERRNRILKFYEKYMVLMGVGGHLIFVFQAHKMLVSHSAEDVSLSGFLISFTSLVSWVIYGMLKKDRVLTGVNLFGSSAALVCIIIMMCMRTSSS